MARITALRVAFRGSKCRSIIVDGDAWRTTSATVVRELGLAEGDDVDIRQLGEAVAAAEAPAARKRAMRLLGYREHGSTELQEKLRADGYPPDLARTTVAALGRVGLVDDDRYAALLARMLIDGRGYGRTRAQREMLHRGLSEESVESALDACYPLSEESARALALACRWAHRDIDVRKLAARLARRGYPVRVAFQAAATALDNPDALPPEDPL